MQRMLCLVLIMLLGNSGCGLLHPRTQARVPPLASTTVSSLDTTEAPDNAPGGSAEINEESGDSTQSIASTAFTVAVFGPIFFTGGLIWWLANGCPG